jgi:hypothetical protein
MSAAAYRTALRKVAAEENAAQHKVQGAFHAHTVSQLRSALSAFAADQRHAAQVLGALTPPADATSANAQLATAFRDNADAISTMNTTLASAKTVKQALHMVQNDHAAQQVGHEIDAALTKLKKLSYTTGS